MMPIDMLILFKKTGSMKTAVFLAAVFFIFFFSSRNVLAARIEMQKDVAATGTFDLGPTSFPIEVYPGQSTSRVLQVTNRMGKEQRFAIEVEDFEGSQDPNNVISLKGKESGRFSAKDWIVPELSEFTLKHGERQFFEVKINVPENADVGDHYAGVLVSAPPGSSEKESKENASPTVNIRSRVGTLFFVNVLGDTKIEGKLESFQTNQSWYEKSPVQFTLSYRNTGTVRIRPEGKVEIFDQFGRSVETLKIEPFNVLRDSVRQAKVEWNRKHLVGRYTAKLSLSRGYEDITDEKTITFWVLPWKLALAVFAGFLVLMILLITAKKYIRFEIKLAKKDQSRPDSDKQGFENAERQFKKQTSNFGRRKRLAEKGPKQDFQMKNKVVDLRKIKK